MAKQTTKVLPPSDKEIIQAFLRVWKKLGSPDDAIYHLDVGQGQVNRGLLRSEGPMSELKNDSMGRSVAAASGPTEQP